VPLLDRAEGLLRLARLVPAWANELADATSSPSSLEGDLWHYLHEDVVNGLLDDSGPLINGSRFGLRFIDSSGRGVYVNGGLLFGTTHLPFRGMGQRILVAVAKEAVLDFARRHGVPPPSSGSDASRGVSQPSRSPGQLKPASTAMINEEIRSEYAAAKAAGRKEPNIKEVQAPVQLRLKQKGFFASKLRIEHLANAEEFKKLRRPPGKTVKSERPK
jgi:hypothetical protein